MRPDLKRGRSLRLRSTKLSVCNLRPSCLDDCLAPQSASFSKEHTTFFARWNSHLRKWSVTCKRGVSLQSVIRFCLNRTFFLPAHNGLKLSCALVEGKIHACLFPKTGQVMGSSKDPHISLLALGLLHKRDHCSSVGHELGRPSAHKRRLDRRRC